MKLRQFAEAIKKAQGLREASYDAAEGRYTMTDFDAAMRACHALGLPIQWSQILDFALHWWNDAELWADGVLKDDGVAEFTRVVQHFNAANSESFPMPTKETP